MEAARLTIVVGRRRSGLFELLDGNDDGRLGLRELHSLSRLAREWDADGDGGLSPAEVPARYTLLVRRGTLAAPYELPGSSNAGPPWFSRLDRNRDGDVSAAEFPGRSELFEQLDSDRDGLIGLSEALRADGRFRNVSLIRESR